MKKSIIATLIAVPALSFSAFSFASEPVSLTSTQMDSVTAGTNGGSKFSFIRAGQINISPVTVVQINALSAYSGNYSAVQSGNFIRVRQ
ncbi:hypothetical protein Q8A64_02490 [Oxalobacteraceae bacterium R-40]|uniref:Antifreeze protein n=1 Tax=Keguizhuia sedimenti TaxID=3064264 RepID=A0ABU1BK71_9BURK|nr:hypothetical protein [Oxalobacteraceae bacterium R-40]